MKKSIAVAALALATAQAVYAETNNKLEEIIVVSSRVEMPLREIGTSVSVLQGPDIQSLGYTTLAEALRTAPGISLSNTGGVGSPTSVFIRGESGYRTRVYIDGIDLANTSGTQSSPNFEHLMANGISRVEVLRGPQGLSYGADAGGVVNISTASVQDGIKGDVSAEGGRYGTQQIAANIAGGNGTIDGAISASDYETDGFNATVDDNVLRDKDGYENTTLHGRIGLNAGENVRLELIARDVEGDSEYDNCFTNGDFLPSNICNNEFEQTAWRGVLQLNYEQIRHEISYMENDTDRQAYTEDDPTFGGQGELKRWEYIGRYRGGEALNFVYGVELQEESFENGGLTRERDQDSAYLEYQGGFADSFFLTAGARYDDNEDFGSHTSYRLSGAYLFDLESGELKLKAAWGTGFRAPSLYEVAYNEDFASPPAFGTELKEEESEGYDIGITWATDGGLYLEAVYFDQEVADPIIFDPVGFSGYLQPGGEETSKGVELIAQAELGASFSVNANYTYNDTEDEAGLQRVRRPEHLANLLLQWRPLNERLILGLLVRGSYDAVGLSNKAIDDYTVVDIKGSFTIWRELSIFGRVENLFDEDYEEAIGFNTKGTAAYAGVRYRF